MAAARTRDPERTRRALLEAGEERFAEDGFRGATAQRIAARAGVNPALISYHFKGKLGLYRAILDRNFARIGGELERVEAMRAPAGRRLAAFIDVFGRFHDRHPALSIMILRQAMAAPGPLAQDFAPHFARIAVVLGGILAQGERAGSFRRTDPFLTHLSLMGSLTLFFATRRLRDRLVASGRIPIASRPPSAAGYVRHVQTLFRRGLAAEKGKP